MENGVPRPIEVYREVRGMAPASIQDHPRPVIASYMVMPERAREQQFVNRTHDTLPLLVALCLVALMTTISAAMLVILVSLVTMLT
ncbi:hypothetical protein [Ectothiorhodospira variabilis]|uniref:hypothetical protein n=1 Tax=Ectothiorhodospira variabilis TaxID=505694 RepID=UPI001EFA8163|nr:hypothetical protein [Ectothiorhodospira variabilis]MCG5495876.1 hypothetical protein [Ectothiorhodospira variabilis]MCG5498521.1 hypothetical protein [Ectothiorhodospira variabilis]MCG5505277.1 hypothetical protein [Ectothiorhodospira variabilis]MCG5508434.1 hypothetical protein [Ectothiorhodospira variabilis]